MVETDEQAALAAIRVVLSEIVAPAATRHSGRLIKTTGDGALIEFPSPVDAVTCAVEVQRAVAERAVSQPEDRRVLLRMGINLGDVEVAEDGDLLGYGVNVAVRLESLADPGGVCVSGKVFEELQGKVSLAFEDRGEQHLKNIVRPIRIWSWRPDSLPHQPVEFGRSARRPVIAVLPFANLSGDQQSKRLAAGITEDIITDLARIPDLLVIARHSTLQYAHGHADVREIGRALGAGYVVEGSFQSAESQIRVTAQLIDAVTGAHLWAKRWTRQKARLFETQDAIVEEIVGSLAGWRGEVLCAERRRFARKPPASLEAYELYLLGYDYEAKFNREDAEKAIDVLERSLALDPNFARAWLVMSHVHNHFEMFQWGGNTEVHRLARRSAVLKAAELDPSDALIQIELGDLSFRDGDVEGAKACYQNAWDLGRNIADVAALLAKYVASILGRPEEALSVLDHAYRLNPGAPPVIWLNELRVCYLTGDYDRALRAAKRLRTAEHSPSVEFTLLFEALSLLELGRLAEAQQTAAQLSASYPSFEPRKVLRYAWINHPNIIARFSHGVERLGF